MIDLPLSNANIPYPDFVLHTVIDPDKFDLNNAELQGKLNATITQVNLNTPEIALKANKTYVDSQDTALQSQINNHTTILTQKADTTYVNSENASQNTLITANSDAITSLDGRLDVAENDILLRTVNSGNHAGTWQGVNKSYFDNQIVLKANSADVYTKAQVDTGLNGKADKTTTYTKVEVDNALALKANSSDMSTQLAMKANVATTYTKTEVDNLLSPKATTAYVDSQLALKANSSSIYTQAQLNATGAGSDGASLIGSAPITGVTGTTVQAKLSSLKTLIDSVAAGGIPDGSVTPAKLDRAYLQLTGGTLSGTLTGTTINATTLQEGGINLSSKYAQLSGATFTGTVNGTTINASANLQEGGTNLSAKYLSLGGGTLTSNLTINKAPAQVILDIGSTTDDTRIRMLTGGTQAFIQSGTNAGAAKNLEIAGWNANNIPTLTLRATSTIATGLIQGTTINATTNLQEAGTNLSSKYLLLSGGTLTNTLTGTTINATSNLQENGTNLTAKYAQLSGATFTGAVSVPDLVKISSGTSSFKGSGTSLIVGGGGSSIFLRPNGDASTTGQLQILSTGNTTVNGDLAVASASTLTAGKFDMSRASITYTGTSTLGDYAMNLNNSDIIGVNGIHFNDGSASFGEGLLWLYSTATAGSTTKADYDCLRVLDSTLYIDVAGTLATKGIDFNSTGTITIQSLDTFTTSNAANVYSSATGVIQRSTSSLRYKENVVDVPKESYDKVLDLRPVHYKSKGSADNPNWTYTGFIAEEVHEIEPKFVSYRENPDGSGELQPDGVQYDRIAVYLTAVVKEQQTRIEQLEATVQQLLNK